MYNDASSSIGENYFNPELLHLLQHAVNEVQLEIPEAEQHRLAELKGFLPALMMKYICLIEVDEPLRKVSISGPQQSASKACSDIEEFLATGSFSDLEIANFPILGTPNMAAGSFHTFQEVWECPMEIEGAVMKEVNNVNGELQLLASMVTVTPMPNVGNAGSFRVQISSSDELYLDVAKTMLQEAANPTSAEKVCPLSQNSGVQKSVLLVTKLVKLWPKRLEPLVPLTAIIVPKQSLWWDVCYYWSGAAKEPYLFLLAMVSAHFWYLHQLTFMA